MHATRLDKVASVIKTGGLVTGEKVPIKPTGGGLGDNRPGQVFFDLTKFTTPPPRDESQFYCMNWASDDIDFCDFAKAILIFDLEALATSRFHLCGNGWKYGDYEMFGKFSSYHWRQREDVLREYFAAKKWGEVVFYEDMPIRFLKEIWVHERSAASLIKSLKLADIEMINGKPLTDVIKISPRSSGR